MRDEARSRAGNKAARLAQALAAGFAVPDGFVVTTAAFRAFLEATPPGGSVPLARAIADRLAAPDAREPARLAQVARAVAGLIESTPLPAEVVAAVVEACGALAARGSGGAATRVAVRSSAPSEDGAARSLAGHFDSFLDITGDAAVLEHVKRCFASAWSERALAARLRGAAADGAADDHAMAVLVQVMVRGGPGGVLFTEDPVSAPGRMVVEYSAGGAEPVAGGEVTPSRLTIERESGRVAGTAGAEPLAAELRGLGLRVEALFGGPQDIEWARGEDGRVYLLQARPITTGAREARDIWTAANSQEAIEDPVTPLTYTYLEPFIERGRKQVFDILGVGDPKGGYMRLFEGRIYFNVNYFRRFLERVPGIPPDIFDLLLFGDVGEVTFPRPPLSLKLLKVAAIVVRTWSGALGRMERFVARLGVRLRGLSAVELPRLSDAALLAHLERVAHLLEEGLNFHVLGSAMAGGHYLLLQKFVRATGVAPDANAVDELLAGEPGIETARSNAAIYDLAVKAASLPAVRRLFLDEDPARVLPRLGKDVVGGVDFRLALHEFLEEFGHRAEKEAELARPRWREDPTFILRAVKKYLELGVGDPNGPSAVRRPADAEREMLERRSAVAARIDRTLSARGGRFGWQRVAFRFLLRSAERSAPYRENLRFHSLRPFAKVRDTFLEVGRRLRERGALERAEDVFFLEAEEALGALGRGDALPAAEARDFGQRSATRRAAYERSLAREAPPKLLYDDGTEAAPPARIIALRAGHEPGRAIEEDGRRYIEGVPVSSGIVTGRVRFVERLEDGWGLEPDEILLARAATPSWTPLFFFARGVILDIGGMLSHCAVIAREYGIPCVVGLKTATSLLKNGDIVTVDAQRGRVYLP